MLRGTQINYMTEKSHAIIIIINTQGQIVQIHLIRKKCLTEMQHETMVWKVVATIRSAKQEPNKIPFLFTIKCPI